MQSVPTSQISIVIPVCGREVWVRRRRGTGHLDGLFEFPGGKLDPGESPIQAAVRELAEETGIERDEPGLRLLDILKYRYPDRTLQMYFFITSVEKAEAPDDGLWILPGDLLDREIPPANRAPLTKLLEVLPTETI